ncbi:hypothetical protein H9P43_009503 [Blastocladiella emersonii ATCC 22665]|nr:hypothetical protein H9P43_009503 [Blastocladiella emersonii ATCC 22665]
MVAGLTNVSALLVPKGAFNLGTAGEAVILVQGNKSAVLDFGVPWTLNSTAAKLLATLRSDTNATTTSSAAFRALNWTLGGAGAAARLLPHFFSAGSATPDRVRLFSNIPAITTNAGDSAGILGGLDYAAGSAKFTSAAGSGAANGAAGGVDGGGGGGGAAQPAAIDWATVSASKSARWSTAADNTAYVLDKVGASHLVLTGGRNGTSFFKDIWTFDLTRNEWEKSQTVMNTPRAYHQSVAYDPSGDGSKVFIITVGGTTTISGEVSVTSSESFRFGSNDGSSRDDAFTSKGSTRTPTLVVSTAAGKQDGRAFLLVMGLDDREPFRFAGLYPKQRLNGFSIVRETKNSFTYPADYADQPIDTSRDIDSGQDLRGLNKAVYLIGGIIVFVLLALLACVCWKCGFCRRKKVPGKPAATV